MDAEAPLADWTLIRTFLAVAEQGSLSAAGRVLGISQPTVGRQVAELEAALGVALFRRQPRGLALTEAGSDLLDPARAMREAAGRLSLAAAGKASAPGGLVRITASVFVANYVLPPILTRLRQDLPEIRVTLSATDASENLLFREADIAIRMYRPEQLDVVTRHLGDIRLGLFAARSYLDRRGRPRSPADIIRHDVIGYTLDDQLLNGLVAMGLPVTRDWFPVACDSHTVGWELLRAGAGIGVVQRPAALADPGLEELLPGLPLPVLPVWLTAPAAIRHTPRIARVWSALELGLSPVVS